MQGKARGRFFEKKLRKKLSLRVPGDAQTSLVKVTKVFCGAFFQKSDLFLASFLKLAYWPSMASATIRSGLLLRLIRPWA